MRSPGLDARGAVGTEREHAHREVGDARVAEALQPFDDRGLVAGGEEIADVGRRRRARAGADSSASTRRARARGSPTPRAPSTSSLPHSATGTPATTRGLGLPASLAAFVMRGTTWSPIARSSAIQRIVPDASSPAIRSITGASAARRTGVGTMSVTSMRVVHAVARRSRRRPARARERDVQHLEVVAHLAGGPVVRQPEHVVDDPVVRRSEPEREAAFAHRLVRQRLLRHRDGMPGLDRHHRGAELDRGSSP